MRLKENPIMSDGVPEVELTLLIDRITVLFVLKKTTCEGWGLAQDMLLTFYKKHPMCLALLGNFMSISSHGPSTWNNIASDLTPMTRVRSGYLCV